MKEETRAVQESDAPQRKRKKEPTEIIITRERCKGCGYCVEFCPKKVLEMSSEINSKGFNIPRVARPDDCIACEVCQYVCPDIAVFVHRTPPAEGEESS